MPIKPYGGSLVDCRLEGATAAEARARAETLPKLPVSASTLSDLYLIAVGALSPLTGFMRSEEYESVLGDMCLTNGLPWSMPITLPVLTEHYARCRVGGEVALVAPDGALAATMRVEEVFMWDARKEAESVYRTEDPQHPGVARLFASGPLRAAGPISYFYPSDISGFPGLNFTPAETRQRIEQLGWRTVAGFQTRNPVHRAHEYLQKCALEMVDGLLLHPLVGDTKTDDIAAEVRVRCYRALLDRYYPGDRVQLAVLPAAMRYAGPREAIFHAIMRRNFGCTHFIVGRDHAGVGNYYGTYDAQAIFEQIDLDALGIVPLFFEHAFFCRACGQMASLKTCPHEAAQHVHLSGTMVREQLGRGERPPSEFTRQEVADILIEASRSAPAAIAR